MKSVDKYSRDCKIVAFKLEGTELYRVFMKQSFSVTSTQHDDDDKTKVMGRRKLCMASWDMLRVYVYQQAVERS